jgi:hypothetical protein
MAQGERGRLERGRLAGIWERLQKKEKFFY